LDFSGVPQPLFLRQERIDHELDGDADLALGRSGFAGEVVILHPQVFFQRGIMAGFPTAVIVELPANLPAPAFRRMRKERGILRAFGFLGSSFSTDGGAGRLGGHGVTCASRDRCHQTPERLQPNGCHFLENTLSGVKTGVKQVKAGQDERRKP
jgi:hypothetical protein